MNPIVSPLALTRRRFLQGAAAAGVSTLLPWSLRDALAAPASVLSGTEFALAIEEVPLTINGRQASATGVNGQVPAPILSWREGDTVSLAVTNRLSEPSSIHWHGVRTPAPMDGVPGLSFRGIMPSETFVYRFPVKQERDLLVPQPFDVPGADRALRRDRHSTEEWLRASVRPRLRCAAVRLELRAA